MTEKLNRVLGEAWEQAHSTMRGEHAVGSLRPDIALWKRRLLGLVLVVLAPLWLAGCSEEKGPPPPPENFNYQRSALVDVVDPVQDDRGPGTYMYPTDSRLRRGDFDMTRFSIYEEGDVVVFAIQMRNYIAREWPKTHQSYAQGFVAQMFDIYINTENRPGAGHKVCLPGRACEFPETGWNKMILVSPLGQPEVVDIVRNKTESLDFQDCVPDIIVPDYVQVQRDRILIRVSKSILGSPKPGWGYQVLAMGFANTVGVDQMLNRRVRAFPSRDDIGGGFDTPGCPAVLDMIVPPGQDQYKVLNSFRSEPFVDDCERAQIPWVRAADLNQGNDMALYTLPENDRADRAVQIPLAPTATPAPKTPTGFTRLANAPVPSTTRTPAVFSAAAPAAPVVSGANSAPAGFQSLTPPSLDFDAATPAVPRVNTRTSAGRARTTVAPKAAPGPSVNNSGWESLNVSPPTAFQPLKPSRPRVAAAPNGFVPLGGSQ